MRLNFETAQKELIEVQTKSQNELKQVQAELASERDKTQSQLGTLQSEYQELQAESQQWRVNYERGQKEIEKLRAELTKNELQSQYDVVSAFGSACLDLGFVREHRSNSNDVLKLDPEWNPACGTIERVSRWNCEQAVDDLASRIQIFGDKEVQLEELLQTLKEESNEKLVKERDECRVDLLNCLRDITGIVFNRSMNDTRERLEQIKKRLPSFDSGKAEEYSNVLDSCCKFLEEEKSWRKRHDGIEMKNKSESALESLFAMDLDLRNLLEETDPLMKSKVSALQSALKAEKTFLESDDPESDKPAMEPILRQISLFVDQMLFKLDKFALQRESHLKKLRHYSEGENPFEIEKLVKWTEELHDIEDDVIVAKGELEIARRKFQRKSSEDNRLKLSAASSKLESLNSKHLDKKVTSERKRAIQHTSKHYPELFLSEEWGKKVGILGSDEIKMELMQQGILLSSTKFHDFETTLISEQHGRAVYKASDLVIKQFYLQNDSYTKRFLRQSALLRKLLPCPFLVSLNGVFLDGNYGYITMPFYKHGSLEAYLKKVTVGIDIRKKLILDVLHGLVFLHSQGHVHGDLKPQNIFVSASNHAVIGDFDGARPMDTTVSYLMATTKYMAPELKIESHISTAADIYSLGVIIQEISSDSDELMRASQSMLFELSEKRPSAQELVVTLGSSELDPKKCSICFELFTVDSGFSCEENHFACLECIEGYLTSKATDPENRYFAKHLNNVKCVVDEFGCCSQGMPLNELKINDQVKQLCFDAIETHKESCTISNLENDFQKRLATMKEEMRKTGIQELQVQEHVDHIVNNILLLCCPRCGQAFDSFEGCFALKCSRQTCQAAFCAWCLTDCGDDAHPHVKQCVLNHRDSNLDGFDGYYGSVEEFETVQKKRRGASLREYWNSRVTPESQEIVAAIRNLIVPMATGISDFIPP